MNGDIDILGLIYIGVLLIFLIIGLCKGLIKSIFSVAGWIISLFLSGLCNKSVTELLMKTSLSASFQTDLTNKFNLQGELYTQTYSAENFKTFADSKSLPDFIRNTIDGIISFLSQGGEGTISEVLSRAIVYYLFLILSFIVLFIIFLLLFKLIGAIVSKIEEGSKVFKFINRTLGAIFYVAIGLALIGVVNYIFAICTITGGEFAKWLETTMKLGTDTWTFSKWLYQNNYLGEIISGIIEAFF